MLELLSVAKNPKPDPGLGWIFEEMSRLAYRIGKEDRWLHLVALRDKEASFNTWADRIGAFWYEDNCPRYVSFLGTTLPGRYYMVDKLLNPKGCAILRPGQYLGVYRLGLHKMKYEAFVQAGVVEVYRDSNRDEVHNFTRVEKAYNIGLNIHSTTGIFPFVNKWSAGCLVVRNPAEFSWLIGVAKKFGQERFSLTLLEF